VILRATHDPFVRKTPRTDRCAVLSPLFDAVGVFPAGGGRHGERTPRRRSPHSGAPEDEGIELRAVSRIRSAFGERVYVNITSYSQVLLTGEVGSAQDKAAVEQLVAKVENTQSVVNELGVMAVKRGARKTHKDTTTFSCSR
jgi:osmotically-inducible protein OsmY